MSGAYFIRHAAKRRRLAVPPAPSADVVPEGSPRWTPERAARVIASGGCYSDIALLAGMWGLPARSVLARWHIVRAR